VLGQLEFEALLDRRRSTADAVERGRKGEVEVVQASVQDHLVALALAATAALLLALLT
jgi:hypothetical protein